MRRSATHMLAAVAIALAASMAMPFVAHGQTNGSASGINDPAFVQGLQWNLTMIGAPQAWSHGRGQGITIAVVDSGIDASHEDLAANVAGGTSCVATGGDPGLCSGPGTDDNGHGTHVAGIAAAVANNSVGVAGVAPDAKLLGIRVLTDHCDRAQTCSAEGDSSDVAAAIRWAVGHGARIINLSLGSDTTSLTSDSLSSALRFAWSHGAIAVIASGNDTDHPLDVGNLPVVVVTAVNRDGRLASYANTVATAHWALAAPGGEPGDTDATCRTGGAPRGVLSTFWDPALGVNQYACLAGTSMAAPHVSGALAILLGLGFTPRQAIERLLATAAPVPGAGPPAVGAGRLDLAKAVAAGPPPPEPPVAPALPATSADVAASGRSATPLATSKPAQPPRPKAAGKPQRLVPEITAGLLVALVAACQLVASRRRQPA